MKYYDADFHSDGLLDNDVREVSSFQKKTKAYTSEIFFELCVSQRFVQNLERN